MRIGIFGGTFDPPHTGHKKYADELSVKLSLDKLIVIPTATPPHKERKTSSAEHRFNMLRLLFGDSDCVEVSDLEISRGGKSYTYETVTLLHEMYPDDELIFLVGSDMLLSFHTWRNPDIILSHVKICAVTRSDDVDKSKLSEYVTEHFSGKTDRFIVCDFDPVEVSSTQIRNAVKNGEPIEGLVDRQVIEYIKEKELYL